MTRRASLACTWRASARRALHRRSGCNAATAATEKLQYESMDALHATLRELHEKVGCDLELWKADIDSAFRRIPLMPSHREFANIAFKHKGNVLVGKHLALPFGALSSAHHWERIGKNRRACENTRT